MIDLLIKQLADVHLPMAEEQIKRLSERIKAIETALTPSEEIDYTDPQLFLVNENNVPVDPSSIDTIPDLVKNLSESSGNPDELGYWIMDSEGIVNLYKPKSDTKAKNKKQIACNLQSNKKEN